LREYRHNSFGYTFCFLQNVTWGCLFEKPLVSFALEIQKSIQHRLNLLMPGWNLFEVIRSHQWRSIVAANRSLELDDPDAYVRKALCDSSREIFHLRHHLMHVDFLAVQCESNGCVVVRGIRWGTFSNLISNSDPECCEIKFSKKNLCFDFCPRTTLELSEYEGQAAYKQSDYHCNAGSDGSPGCPVDVTGRADGPAFTEAFFPTHSLIPLWIGRHFAMSRNCPQGASNA